MYFGQGEDLKLTTELSEKVQYSEPPDNQKRLKWSNTAYVNKKKLYFRDETLCLSSNQDLILYEGDSNF